jgi:hypothetical protein
MQTVGSADAGLLSSPSLHFRRDFPTGKVDVSLASLPCLRLLSKTHLNLNSQARSRPSHLASPSSSRQYKLAFKARSRSRRRSKYSSHRRDAFTSPLTGAMLSHLLSHARCFHISSALGLIVTNEVEPAVPLPCRIQLAVDGPWARLQTARILHILTSKLSHEPTTAQIETLVAIATHRLRLFVRTRYCAPFPTKTQ